MGNIHQMSWFKTCVGTEAGAHDRRPDRNFDRDRGIDSLGYTDGGSCVFGVTVVGVDVDRFRIWPVDRSGR